MLSSIRWLSLAVVIVLVFAFAVTTTTHLAADEPWPPSKGEQYHDNVICIAYSTPCWGNATCSWNWTWGGCHTYNRYAVRTQVRPHGQCKTSQGGMCYDFTEFWCARVLTSPDPMCDPLNYDCGIWYAVGPGICNPATLGGPEPQPDG